jgi:hypothetical protein
LRLPATSRRAYKVRLLRMHLRCIGPIHDRPLRRHGMSHWQHKSWPGCIVR